MRRQLQREEASTNLRERQWLGGITKCTPRVITAGVHIFGNRLSGTEARRRSERILKGERKENQYACLYEIAAVLFEGKIYYRVEPNERDPGLTAHEEFHTEVASLGIPSVGLYRFSMEESAAYAIGDARLAAASDSEVERRKHLRQGVASVQFLVGTDNPRLSEMREAAIRTLCETRNMIGDKIAIAMTIAEGLICYLESAHIIEQYGKTEGRKVLLDAVRVAAESGPENARVFLHRYLSRSRKAQIESSYGIERAMHRLRPLHSKDYEEEIVVLR